MVVLCPRYYVDYGVATSHHDMLCSCLVPPELQQVIGAKSDGRARAGAPAQRSLF